MVESCQLNYKFRIMALALEEPFVEFDPLLNLEQVYAKHGYSLLGKTEWTGVPQGTTNADVYDYSGYFAISAHATNSTNLIITSNLSEKKQKAPAVGNVLQHYLQFRDWDMQVGDFSYMDFVCNFVVGAAGHTITKSGSCGSKILASITTGPSSRVKGEVAADATRCNTDAVLKMDSLGYPFNVTDSYSVETN